MQSPSVYWQVRRFADYFVPTCDGNSVRGSGEGAPELPLVSAEDGPDQGFCVAEGQGFEPWVTQNATTVFKTVSLGHSDSPPGWIGAIRSGCQTRQLIAGQMVLDSEVPGSPLCWAGAR